MRQRPVVNRLVSPHRKSEISRRCSSWRGTKADEPFASFMTSLGLTCHEVPGDGDCLFHPLRHLLKAAKKDIFAAGALREVGCNALEANVEGYHTVWDWKFSDDSQSLQLGFMCAKHEENLGVEQGNAFDCCRAAVWVKSERRHYEPIVTSADVATVANRRQHCKEIHKAYKWTTVITMKAAAHLIGNEGRGLDQSRCALQQVKLCSRQNEEDSVTRPHQLRQEGAFPVKVSKRERTAKAVSGQVFFPPLPLERERPRRVFFEVPALRFSLAHLPRQ